MTPSDETPAEMVAPAVPSTGEQPVPEESSAPESSATPPTRRPNAHRFAPMLLLAGVFAIASMVRPHLPRERHIDLRLAGASTVTGVELAWTRQGDGEPVLGSAWHFAIGDAPGSIDATVSLPDGRYELDVTIERAGAPASYHRSLTIADADRIAIPFP